MKSRITKVKPGILNWLEEIRFKGNGWGKWPYHSKMQRDWGLQSSCISIQILQMLDELDKIPEKHRQDFNDFVCSCYDNNDNFFKDPLENESIREGNHNWIHIWGQRSGAVRRSLKILGFNNTNPSVKPSILIGSDNDISAKEWTNSLDWSDPWIAGEVWLRVVEAILDNSDGNKFNAFPFLDELLAAMKKDILDSSTGMPTVKGCDDRARAMAGLFKILIGYRHSSRPFPYARQAIDFTLDLQFDNGEFGYRRDMTMNWDALYILYYLNMQLNHSYRFNDIKIAGNKTAEVLMNEYRKPDGGFAFYGDTCLTKHCSIILCDKPYQISDVLGTWMALVCLSYSDKWNQTETAQI